VSCSRTYATLRIFSDNLDPTDVTTRLGIMPTTAHVRGDRRGGNAAPYRHGMWSLSTMAFESLDVREHIDQLLDLIEPAGRVLAELRLEGTTQDIFCFWATDNGQGGPSLDPIQMGRLAALDLPVGFDLYRT
jgi:hypothetical protein